MLNPKKKTEHLIYGDILIPPTGFPVLERAIATTFSLDISALVSCMIPLAFSDDVNSKLFQNKVSTLTALRNLSEKLIIFCDPSQIKSLKTRNKEFAILLEKMVLPVQLKKLEGEDVFPSFHPKFWLLQFADDKGNHCYRLIILSRNISYDKSYDISLVLDSYTEERKRGEPKRNFNKTKNILDFISYLSITAETSKTQKEQIIRLINDITDEQVCFKVEQPFDVEDFDFYPIYEQTFRSDKRLFDKTVLKQKGEYKKLFVMSPFITKDILLKLPKSLKNQTDDNHVKVITRQDSINKLENKDGISNIDFYVLNPDVISGEEQKIEDSPEAEDIAQKENEQYYLENLHDIHAKIFLTETSEKKQIFLGSANATNSAFNRNVEFMVRLSSKSNALSVDNFFKDLNIDNNMFIPAVEGKEETENIELQTRLENTLRTITHQRAKGFVECIDGSYSIMITFEEYQQFDSDIVVTLSPINSSENKLYAQKIKFEDIPVSSLSEFYYLKVSSKDNTKDISLERLIKIPTDNIPYEERDCQIINQIITNKEAFTEYVTLLLSQDSISTQLEMNEIKENSAKWKVSNSQMPLYETLLRASVTNPQAVLNLGKDIDLITNKEIVSDDFKQLYEQFRQIVSTMVDKRK